MDSALYTQYKEQVIPALRQEFGYRNVLEVPKVKKVVLNVGFGRHVKDAAYLKAVENTLTKITGQKPVMNKAKKSISNFKIREGMVIGASVTLRGRNMYEFLYKLIHLTLPRVRDFRGLHPKSFDKSGNYSIGFKENLAFPEMGGQSGELLHGIEVTVSTSAATPAEGKALLGQLGFPFRDK